MKIPVAGPQKELPSRAWMNTRQVGYLIPAACNQLAGLGMHSRCRGHLGAGAGLALDASAWGGAQLVARSR